MNNRTFSQVWICITLIVSQAIWGLLAWNHFHGGIPSHHIMARKDLPEFSNAWGAILLPAFTWFTGWRIQKRESLQRVRPINLSNFPLRVIYGFAGGLLSGISLSVLFTLEYHGISGYLLQGILFLSLFYPIYRVECLLGFVIGMTFTFGVILPLGVGSIVTGIGCLIYKLIRPALVYTGRFLYRSLVR